tara:strand:- start:2426 stop:2842 length:417 start_codon:yes stop_codon:yes gene_type:complete
MIDESTKFFLIKAIIEGIPCKFDDVEDIMRFAESIITTIDENEDIMSTLHGDADGLLLSDEYGEPYVTITFNNNRVKFNLLVHEDDVGEERGAHFARVVLSVVGLAIKKNAAREATKKKIKTGVEMINTFKPDFGIVF